MMKENGGFLWCLLSVVASAVLLVLVNHGHCDLLTHKPTSWDDIRIETSGWYFISLIIDPIQQRSVSAWIIDNNINPYLVANGDRSVAGFDCVLYLKSSDVLKVENSSSVGTASMIMLTQLSSATHFTARSLGTLNASKLSFSWLVGGTGLTPLNSKVQFLTPGSSGIYWVSVTIESFQEEIGIVSLKTNTGTEPLFWVYAGHMSSTSAAAALYLKPSQTIWLESSISNYAFGTFNFLTVVNLWDNKKPNTGNYDHVAWTGRRDANLQYLQLKKLSMAYNLLDYGNLYTWQTCTLRFSIRGYYLISLRAVPTYGLTTALDLYLNDLLVWTAYSEHGVPSGQTIVMSIQINDTLIVKPDSHTSGTVENATMMSVAFVKP